MAVHALEHELESIDITEENWTIQHEIISPNVFFFSLHSEFIGVQRQRPASARTSRRVSRMGRGLG